MRQLLDVASWLEVPPGSDRDRLIDELATLSQGSLDRAREYGDAEMLSFLDHLLTQWCRPETESWSVAKEIHAFMEKAGKEAPAKRSRLRLIIERLIGQMRGELCAAAPQANAMHGAGSADTLAAWESISQRIDRSLTALEQIDSFGNLANIIECWIDDVWQIVHGTPVHEHPTH